MEIRLLFCDRCGEKVGELRCLVLNGEDKTMVCKKVRFYDLNGRDLN